MFMMGFGHLRRWGAGGEAPAVLGVTHPCDLPSTSPEPDSKQKPAGNASGKGGVPNAVQLNLPDAVERLVGDGLFYLTKSEMAADALGAGAPLKPIGTPAPIGWIRALAKWEATRDISKAGARCIAWNIDSLYLCVYADIMPCVLSRMLDLFELSRERGESEPVYIASGGRQWLMTWAGSGYALRLEIPSVASIKVAKKVGPHAPQVYVELRAEALWQYGPERLVEDITSMISSWEQPRSTPTRVEVSRLDMAADFVGFDLDGSELPAGRWSTRAEHRGLFFRSGRFKGRIEDPQWGPSQDAIKRAKAKAKAREDAIKRAKAKAKVREREQREADKVDALYWRGRTYTGGAFGTGHVRCRHYRKDIEMKSKRSGSWLKQFWRAGGWQEGQAVMRVEAQYRGAALKHIIGVSKHSSAVGSGKSTGYWEAGDVTAGNSWRAVRRHLDALWRYMMGDDEKNGWICLHELGTGSRVDRWAIDARWLVVRAVEWGPVVSGHGLGKIDVRRWPKTPTKKHEAGPKWAVDAQAGEIQSTDIDEIVEHVSGPDAVFEWGTGPRSKSKRIVFGNACEEYLDAEVQVLSAEERRDGLFKSVRGMVASLGAAHAIEERREHEAIDHRAVLKWLAEEIDKDLEDFATRTTAARQRFAMRGAIAYRSQRNHKRGNQRYLPGFRYAGVQ